MKKVILGFLLLFVFAGAAQAGMCQTTVGLVNGAKAKLQTLMYDVPWQASTPISQARSTLVSFQWAGGSTLYSEDAPSLNPILVSALQQTVVALGAITDPGQKAAVQSVVADIAGASGTAMQCAVGQ